MDISNPFTPGSNLDISNPFIPCAPLNGRDIYDPAFAVIYSTVHHITSGVALVFILFLMFIIITQTPPLIKDLKIYLIPYCINLVIIKLVWIIYTPIILHPFLYIYPTGLAQNLSIFSPKILLFLGIAGVFSSFSMVDCCIGIALERAFLLRRSAQTAHLNHSFHIPNLHLDLPLRVPLIIFICLTTLIGIILIFGICVCFIKSLFVVFFVPAEGILPTIEEHIHGLGDIINPEKLLIIQDSGQNSLPLAAVAIFILAGIHTMLAIFLIIFNGWQTYQLKNFMPMEMQKVNSMLLKMNYFQFCGFFIFLACPMGGIIAIYFHGVQPNLHVNWLLVVMNSFGLYDPIMTILCIKPYRTYIKSLIKLPFRSQKNPTIMVSSCP